jgi:hypothetical protein
MFILKPRNDMNLRDALGNTEGFFDRFGDPQNHDVLPLNTWLDPDQLTDSSDVYLDTNMQVREFVEECIQEAGDNYESYWIEIVEVRWFQQFMIEANDEGVAVQIKTR